jgi:hypothetical protein
MGSISELGMGRVKNSKRRSTGDEHLKGII